MAWAEPGTFSAAGPARLFSPGVPTVGPCTGSAWERKGPPGPCTLVCPASALPSPRPLQTVLAETGWERTLVKIVFPFFAGWSEVRRGARAV